LIIYINPVINPCSTEKCQVVQGIPLNTFVMLRSLQQNSGA